MIKKIDDRTLHITPDLNVQERLKQLREWLADWQAEERKLADFVNTLSVDSPVDVQMGSQAKVVRTYNRLILAQQPIEIDASVIQKFGYGVLRDHLVSQFASLSKETRKRWMQNGLFLMVPELRLLYDKISRIRVYRSLGQQRNFLLGGPSGMGKTTCLDWMVFNNQPSVELERNHVPIVKIDAPVSNNSVTRILQQMILRCGKTYIKRDTESMLHDKVVLIFQQCGVEVVIVDEIQHLITHRMRRHLLEISNENRGIPFICASCNPTEFIQGDSEIAGRWNDYFPLNPYKGKDLEKMLSFVELLLPFTQHSHLGFRRYKDGGDGPAKFIEDRTGGILRDIMILITDATMLAIDRGEPHLTTEILAASWQNIQENAINDFLKVIQLTSNP